MGAFFTRLFSFAKPVPFHCAKLEEPLLDILSNPHLSDETDNEPRDEEMCWICHDDERVEELFHSPCHCNTSIHLSCMFRWYAPRTELVVNSDKKTYTAHVRCEVCFGDMSPEFAPVIIGAIQHIRGILGTSCANKPHVCMLLSALYVETLVGRRAP